MTETLIKLLLAAVLTLLIKGGVALTGHWIAWWLAALISLAVVFGGWLIITDTDGAWD
ncbi:hypothetical protein AB0B63_18535 [Micromonospora sp. NPDC049081]|uniref:hypothetical protein n=1 Tax=Micromonospora sp. NPDC049081 TaxID=3155150 RepID=UPI0034111F0A